MDEPIHVHADAAARRLRENETLLNVSLEESNSHSSLNEHENDRVGKPRL